MKKVWSIVIVTVLMLALLAGCGSSANNGDSGNGGNNEVGAEPVTISLLIDNQSDRSGIEAVAAAIEERYNITTEIEIRPGGDEGDNVVRTRLATGEMSDIIWYNSGALFAALGPENFFVDLTDQPFMQNIDEGFKLATSVDGRAFGIPGEFGMGGGWLYNRRVYEELGLSVPNTWQELMENNQVIQDAGIIPVIASFADSWTSQLVFLADYYNVYMYEADFADRWTRNEIELASSPVGLRSFERLAELHESGFMNDDRMATTYEDAIYLLASGAGAHYPMLSFALGAIAEMFPEYIDDIGMFGQPGDGSHQRGLTMWTPAGLYLNQNSPHQESLFTWAEFFTSSEGVEIYMSARAPNGPLAITGVSMPADIMPAVQDMQAYIDTGRTVPALEFLSPLKGPSLEQILVEVGMGIITPEEGAAAYQQDVVMQARQLGLEGW